MAPSSSNVSRTVFWALSLLLVCCTPRPESEEGGHAPESGWQAGSPNARIGPAQCEQMYDRYVGLVIVKAGVEPTEEARTKIKAMIADDPHVRGFRRACHREGTLVEYRCAMAAQTESRYRSCISRFR